MCDGGYELVGSGGACGAELRDVEGSHHPSNPILEGKMQTLNVNDDDVLDGKMQTLNMNDDDDDDDDVIAGYTSTSVPTV